MGEDRNLHCIMDLRQLHLNRDIQDLQERNRVSMEGEISKDDSWLPTRRPQDSNPLWEIGVEASSSDWTFDEHLVQYVRII